MNPAEIAELLRIPVRLCSLNSLDVARALLADAVPFVAEHICAEQGAASRSEQRRLKHQVACPRCAWLRSVEEAAVKGESDG